MLKKIALLIPLISFVHCKNPPARQAVKPDLKSIMTDFDHTIQKYINSDSTQQSISFAVMHKDRILWSKAFGYADKENNIHADTSTIYRTGSISKSFTAFLMMQLVGKGLLKLNDPVESYLPEIRRLKGYNDSTKITFLQLATHSSGLEREPELADAADGPISSWEQKVLAAIPETSFESRPGTNFNYSNIGYAILGLALSRAAGQPFMTLMEENIFTPLQMNNTCYIVPPEKFTKLAKGRSKAFGQLDLATPQREHFGRGYKVPNGGIYSTPNDLSKFIMAELGVFPLLNANALATIQTGKLSASGEAKYGLGLYIYAYDNKILIHHSGSVAGYSAEMDFEKNSEYGVAIMCNYNTVGEMLGFYAQQLLDQLSALDDTAAPHG
ncbi:MAG TPA: serine hydrolase domain-containing protein [Puia sp.]|nr:serine hydrolase domain-containing protein [Puia sp.]